MTGDRVTEIAVCEIDACEGKARRKGLCDKHYMRIRRGAEPSPVEPVYESRFWAKVDATGDCWEWVGHLSEDGYGRCSSPVESELFERHVEPKYPPIILLLAASAPSMEGQP